MHRSDARLPSRNAVFLICVLLAGVPCRAQQVSASGLVSGWGLVTARRPVRPAAGLRFLPAVHIEKAAGAGTGLDAELSLNVYGTVRSGEAPGTGARLYRGWVRYSGPRFEARLGLQKINFGSAVMLRPLMWFDRIDPRDPLQLTAGVKGLLVRGYFLNNANVWAWGLLGNTDPGGWELFGSRRTSPEFGGRIQVPVPAGEAAVTFHHRKADPAAAEPLLPQSAGGAISENRYAVDFRFDITIGFWLEAVLVQQDIDLPLKNRKMVTVGADYTFAAGNGLLVTAEHMLFRASKRVTDAGEGFQFSALSLSYPLNLLDAFTVMVYRDWENRGWYRFARLQRTLDNWRFYAMVFWNPDDFELYPNLSRENLFAGSGAQVMAVYTW